jgi:hypothetical protein
MTRRPSLGRRQQHHRRHAGHPADGPAPERVKLSATRTWTVRPLDPAATIASWRAGRLLGYGGTWDDEAQRQRAAVTSCTGRAGGWVPSSDQPLPYLLLDPGRTC